MVKGRSCSVRGAMLPGARRMYAQVVSASEQVSAAQVLQKA